MIKNPRGFTLLIALVLTAVVLAIGLALLEITYKQEILASAAKQSQTAFYNADSALECALYYDQQRDFFDANPFNDVQGSVQCNGQAVSFTTLRSGSSPKATVFTVPCEAGGTSAQVTVYKNAPGTPKNLIFSTGYNTCDTANLRRLERGLKVTY
jgi:Tfp pilus assembly protein PilE